MCQGVTVYSKKNLSNYLNIKATFDQNYKNVYLKR